MAATPGRGPSGYRPVTRAPAMYTGCPIPGMSDVQASNIPGMGHPVYMAGARVTGLYPLGPRPGVAAMIAMISYDGTCCIGLNVDPDVIGDLEVFESCLREGFDEVLALRKEQ